MRADQKKTWRLPVQSRNRFVLMLVLYATYVFALIHIYDFQIAEANAYIGMQPWEMSVAGWFALAIALPLIALMATRTKGNPSDFFIIFYSAIPLISILALTSVSGKVESGLLLPSLLIVAFPLFVLWVFQQIVPGIRWRAVVPSVIVERTILGILFVTIFFLWRNAPESAGFSIDFSYDRRLEGRELYPGGSFLAYALSMCMNGLAPYLAFKGVVSGRISLVLTAILSVIFFYWLLGTKAPVLYVLMGCLIGILANRKSLQYLVQFFLLGIIGLYLLVLIEWWLFDNYSIIADYGFRRLFAVQAQIQGYFLDFLLVEPPSGWNWLTGTTDPSFQVTYYIGGEYFGQPDANANTNAFLYAFAAKGLWGYLFAALFVPFFLVCLDRLYRSTQNPNFLFIGFIYGVLVTEQSFTTAMVSSGVGLLFLLTLLENDKANSRGDMHKPRQKVLGT